MVYFIIEKMENIITIPTGSAVIVSNQIYIKHLIRKYCVINVQGAKYVVEGNTLAYRGSSYASFFTESESDKLIEEHKRLHTGYDGTIRLSDASTCATIGMRLDIAKKILFDICILYEHNPSSLFKTFFILYNGAIGPPNDDDNDNYPLEGIFKSISSISKEAIVYTLEDYSMKEQIIEISRHINIDNADNSLDIILSMCEIFYNRRM